MYRAISDLYEQFPKATFKTYIVDRGKEFACYLKVEADLAQVSDEEINEAFCLINHRPRKCLG